MPHPFINILRKTYPNFTFNPDKNFHFHPPKTIFYNPSTPNSDFLTLHELAHALLGHHDYNLDIELIQIESTAWQKTEELCQKHATKWLPSVAEDNLDSYRNWLHHRSLCPNCKLSGYQRSDRKYHCLSCGKIWQSRTKKH